jgi:hypothetical protein
MASNHNPGHEPGHELDHKPDQQRIWQFIRGDLPTAEFESWLYNSKGLENLLGRKGKEGNELYQDLMFANFKDENKLGEVKKNLQVFLREHFPLNCECVNVPDFAVVDEGSEYWCRIFATLTRIKTHESRWWLNLFLCDECGDYWLHAQESRINDVDFFKRLDQAIVEKIAYANDWPNDFKTYEDLLFLGMQNNRSVRFDDPLSDSLIYTVKDLTNDRPSITTKELAALLSVSEKQVAALCRKPPSRNKPWRKKLAYFLLRIFSFYFLIVAVVGLARHLL